MANKKEHLYYFKVELCGQGYSPEEAWQNAIEAFIQNPGNYDKVKKGGVIE